MNKDSEDFNEGLVIEICTKAGDTTTENRELGVGFYQAVQCFEGLRSVILLNL